MKVMNEPFVHINNAWKLVRQTRNSGIDEDIEDMTVVARDLNTKSNPSGSRQEKLAKTLDSSRKHLPRLVRKSHAP